MDISIVTDTTTRTSSMKKIGEFELSFKEDRTLKRMPVEILVDREHTTIILDCSCCKESLSNRLPGGVLIPIASTLKKFFENQGMRNLHVSVSGAMMRRVYQGIIDENLLSDLKAELSRSVSKFSKRKK